MIFAAVLGAVALGGAMLKPEVGQSASGSPSPMAGSQLPTAEPKATTAPVATMNPDGRVVLGTISDSFVVNLSGEVNNPGVYPNDFACPDGGQCEHLQ